MFMSWIRPFHWPSTNCSNPPTEASMASSAAGSLVSNQVESMRMTDAEASSPLSRPPMPSATASSATSPMVVDAILIR